MQATPNFDFIKVDVKNLQQFVYMLAKLWRNFVSTVVNGHLGFGDGTNADNLDGAWANIVAPVAPNTDLTITHNLGRLPVGYWAMTKDRACDIYTGSIAATKTQITLRFSAASAIIRLFIVCLVLAASTFGQNARKDDIATFNSGGFVKVIPSALITVCTSAGSGIPCTPLVTGVCASASDAVCTQPASFTADINGNYGFWIQPGTYVVTITGTGVVGKSIAYVLSAGGGGGGGGGGGLVPAGTPPQLQYNLNNALFGAIPGTGFNSGTNATAFPGAVQAGTNGAAAGNVFLPQGPLPSLLANGITHFAPTAVVTAYGIQWPAAGCSGFLSSSFAASVDTLSCAAGATGYNLILNNGTSVTARSTVNVIPAGSIGTNCIDNSGATRTDCTFSGAAVSPGPALNKITATSYTVPNGDNTWRDVFTAASAVAVTLPQAGSYTGSTPFVSVRGSVFGPCTTCTTGSFSQSSGHQLFVVAESNVASASVSSCTDTAGDTLVRLAPDQTTTSGGNAFISVWWSSSVVASGANTVSCSVSNFSTGQAGVITFEYQTLTFDHSTSGNGAAPNSLTNSVSNVNEIGLAFSSVVTSNCPGAAGVAGWIFRNQSGISSVYDKSVTNESQITYPGCGGGPGGEADVMADFGIPGILSFTNGWFVSFVNQTPAIVTVTPTTSTINGQATLKLAPNEACVVMSDGTNYNAFCGFQPNYTNGTSLNGLINSPVGIAGVNTSNTGSDVTTTTLTTTGASDAVYRVDAAVICRSSVAGTETVTITFTDTNGIVQTLTGVTGTCNGGTPADGLLTQTFRAKAATNLQYATSHTGTQPNFDVSVQLYQVSTQ